MKQVRFLILGAGPTGLAAGYRLNEVGVTDFAIVDKAMQPGGLSQSFVDDKGFTWDIGGHVQFSHYDYFDNLMEKALGAEGWLHHQRESWAWMHNRFVPYPVQNNIRHLPKDVMWKCLEGIIDANLHAKPAGNFHEWILATFGQGFAEEFMVPYNFKVWAYPPEKLSYSWIGERVAVTDLKRVTKNILFEKDDLSWGPNNTFRFPKHGGTGAIWQSVANLLGRERILLQSEVVAIDTKKKLATMKDGAVIAFEHCLSTLPLDLLVKMISGPIDTQASHAASGLTYSTSNIVGIGLKGKPSDVLRTKCWMYFPEKNCPFYRATVFSNYSPNNVPDIKNFWSLMTETSESVDKPLRRENLVEDTIQGALNTGLIANRSDVVSTWVYSAAHGYPTPYLKRDEHLQVLNTQLEALGIHSRGRFGAWKYEVSNQDHSAMQGVEWVNRILFDIPEVTFRYPNIANSNWGRKR
jgi:protoporphyrinogen oxidase